MSDSDHSSQKVNGSEPEETLADTPSLEEQLHETIVEFENARDCSSTAFYVGTPQTKIGGQFVHQFHKFLRKQGKYEELDLILDSGGGKLDSSVKIVNICNQYSNNVNVFVPFYAKSAATVIALSADNLYLGRAGELGPVDPIVPHPSKSEVFVSAHSVIDAVNFIEQKVSDDAVKSELASQLDIHWIGFGQRAIEQSRQYLNDIEQEDSREFAKRLVDEYKDHGYPIDRTRCDELDIPIMEEDAEIEKTLYDVHETAIELYDEQNLVHIIAGSESLNKETKQSPDNMIDELLDELPEETSSEIPEEVFEEV
jgi:hypothetical protein